MADMAGDDLELRRRRALYRAQHRGTKEMDWMIGRFAEAKLTGMDAGALMSFEQFLAVTDVELQAWILQPELVVGTDFDELIVSVRAFHHLDEKAV
jgi:antitoxin CptB